jgi:hypothetical protein
MSSIIYPLHFQRRFERRWASRMVSDELRRSPSRRIPVPADTLSLLRSDQPVYPRELSMNGGVPLVATTGETIADPGIGSTKPVR